MTDRGDGPLGGASATTATKAIDERVSGAQGGRPPTLPAAWVLERMVEAQLTLDREFRIVGVNPAAERLLEKPAGELLGRSHWEAFPASVSNDAGRAYRRVVDEGVAQHLAQHYAAEGYDLHVEIAAYPTEAGGVAIFLRDVTEQVRAEAALRASEARHAFLLALSDALRDLRDPAAVQAAAARVLGERLGADHAYYVEVDEARAEFVVEGGPWVVTDVETDPALPDDQRAAYRGNDIGACVVVPLVMGGRLVATLAVNQHAPRVWTPVEVALVEATAERTWAAVERARAEAALRASEARYRTLFEAIDEGFCVIEVLFDAGGAPVDYRVLEANPALVQQSGLTDAVGRTMRELAPAHEAYWYEIYGRVALTGEPTRFEAPAAALGRWYDVYAFRVGEPAERRVAVLFTDVAPRKRAEAALQASEARYRALAMASADVLYRMSPDWGEMRQLDGRSFLSDTVEPSGAWVGRYIHPDDQVRVTAAIAEAVRTRSTFALEHRVVRADGTLGWTFSRAVPLLDAGGEITEWIGAASDVTERHEAEAERERLLAETEHARRAAESAQARAESAGREADAANHAKSGFLATMSHELRTPVNAVIGYADLLDLGLGGPLTEQQRGYLARLAASGRHLLGLVNDVLDLSKIEAGATRVAQRDGMTGGPVRAALEAVAPAATSRGVRLTDARPDDAGVPFVGDEDRVRQVVLNLLSNAVRFTPPGGTVTVTCDTVREAPPPAAHLRGAGPWAVVRVEDTGLGIAPEEQGRIFEPFHQVESGKSSYTRTTGGTGLGLAISRQLARLMGGDLTVVSAPGAGSTFTLWLPASRHDAGQPAETAAERGVRAERDLAHLETPGLGEVGTLLHEAVTEIVGAYADRLRADPAVPRAAALTRVQLEDHAISFLADLAQSLVIVSDAEAEAVELLKDGSAIQRTIAEAHGARRYAQGWDEAALRRDQQIFREEVERAVRARLKAGSDTVEDAVHTLLGLIERGQGLAVRTWRRAARDATA